MSHSGSAALGRVFIVGIGGAGMSAYARLLMATGVTVGGSDAKDSKRLSALRAEGATVSIGHDAAHLTDTEGRPLYDTVAASTAVPANNPELLAAARLGLQILDRAALLAAITAPYSVVSVAGTHGKTTTTSMLTLCLQESGFDPSFAIGSELNELGSNAHIGDGEVFVVEADESDGTFLRLSTDVAVVTNVEPDHLNYWGTFDKLQTAFVDFIAGAGKFAVVCADDTGAAELAREAAKRGIDIRTYGQAESADFRIRLIEHNGSGWDFTITHGTSGLGHFSLRVPGVHNVLNATAALVAAHGLGADLQHAAHALGRFSGTRRRFDFKGEAGGVRVYDDYAHHPTEIAATLTAARDLLDGGRLVVAFQAHHYYRTALFSREFGEALGRADEVVVLEVFAPGEEFIAGAGGRTLADNVTLPPEHVVFEPSWSEVAGHLVRRAKSGDIIMTLGAGEIGMLCPEILSLLAERDDVQT